MVVVHKHYVFMQYYHCWTDKFWMMSINPNLKALATGEKPNKIVYYITDSRWPSNPYMIHVVHIYVDDLYYLVNTTWPNISQT